MDRKTLDIYSDLLFANSSYATATSFSDALDGKISHDKFSHFLRHDDYDAITLWKTIKTKIKTVDNKEKAVLCFDDSIIEKPHTKENSINCWHYSHTRGWIIKGINLLSSLAVYPNARIPFSYKIIKKCIEYSDLKTKKIKRRASTSKNELMREIFKISLKNIDFNYVLADSWFCCRETLKLIHESNKKFIFGIKSNRIVYKTISDKEKGNEMKLSELDLKEGHIVPVFLNSLDFQVRVMKKVFTNENGHQGTLYLVTNDAHLNAIKLYNTYQKRWAIEEYHKSLKHNVSIGQSPTKTVRTQSNHIFASIYAYANLEALKLKTNMNHFALKRKIYIQSLKAARKEIEKLKKINTAP